VYFSDTFSIVISTQTSVFSNRRKKHKTKVHANQSEQH